MPSVLDPGIDTQPQRHASDYLENTAPKTPDVDGPGIFVPFHFLEHDLVVLQLVLEENVVKYFRGHVLRSGHGKLFKIGEQETATKVYELDSFDVGRSWSHILLPPCLKQNVLSLEVGVHNVMTVHEEEGLHYFDHQHFQLVLVITNFVNQVLILDLHEINITL